MLYHYIIESGQVTYIFVNNRGYHWCNYRFECQLGPNHYLSQYRFTAKQNNLGEIWIKIHTVWMIKFISKHRPWNMVHYVQVRMCFMKLGLKGIFLKSFQSTWLMSIQLTWPNQLKPGGMHHRGNKSQCFSHFSWTDRREPCHSKQWNT